MPRARSSGTDSASFTPTATDPGPESAGERASAVEAPGPAPIRTPNGTLIRFGTASWTDPTLVRAGVFYPRDATSAEARLKYYATRFSMVEADSPYYALPARQTIEAWADRTPDTFRFDIKAHALMTGQPSEVARLPADIRDALPPALAAKSRLYAKDLPPELSDAVWATFLDALLPLRESDKLGAVLMQYPRWFLPGHASRDQILDAHHRFGDVPFSVELRNALWFNARNADHTLRFFEDHGIPFVMVDEPQGLKSSVPPVVAVTAPRLAVIRFHGRRTDMWERPGVTTAEKFRYLYDRAELETWAPRVREIAGRASDVHVVMNNCYANYGTTNAIEIAAMVRRIYSAE
jgi:uncharacterized protein YecE (DUF72 family)